MLAHSIVLVSLAAGGTSDSLARFIDAQALPERQRLALEVVREGTDIDEVIATLRQGRSYGEAPTGRLLRERTGVNGLRHPYMILVPKDYDPERRWPVRFDLHGGMGAKEWKALDGAWSPGWQEVSQNIVIVPAGWWDSMWWEWSQAENFEAILREVRATWNIDEQRVVMFGSSDGGAALFFQAMRTPDRWSGYAGVVAPPDRLVRADFRPDGQMHPSNLARQRFHLGFGEKDAKVPLDFLSRYMQLFEDHGALIEWYVKAGQGHSLRLDDKDERALGQFLFRTQRDPLPDELSWATERTDRYARRSWLVINELMPAAADHVVDETNTLPRWGTRIQLKGPTAPRLPWGRVDLSRSGNRITARTRRVKKFTLLISPDEFDLLEPIVVEVDGAVLFEGIAEPSVECLLRWAAIDDDRSLIFPAAIEIRL